MRIEAILTCFCIALLTAGGCDSWRAWKGSAAPLAPPDKPVEKSAASDDENTTLKSRNMILEARLAELQGREERLAAEVNRLRFLVRQQENEIAALADAPKQRDVYKKRCESLSREVARLSRRIEELIAAGAVPSQGSDRPRTRPAGQSRPARTGPD